MKNPEFPWQIGYISRTIRKGSNYGIKERVVPKLSQKGGKMNKELLELSKKYTLKNIKKGRGLEGDAIEFDLYDGKTKILHYWDDADGGEASIEIKDKVKYDILEKEMESIPAYNDTVFNLTTECDVEIFCDEMYNIHIYTKERKKMLKELNTYLMFRRKGDEPGACRTLKRMYTPDIDKKMEEKYPDLEVLYNKTNAKDVELFNKTGEVLLDWEMVRDGRLL